MMGIYTEKPFKTFTEHGFPPELIAELEKRCGKKVIGNRSESGTKIIEELGEEEIETGAMIVYTSADSVLRICGNEETFDLANLYRCCEIAREITMKDEWRVGRVIARPYVQLAYNNHPGMQIVRQQTLLAENDIRLTKANYLPSLSLHAGNTLARPLSTTLADMYTN